MDNSSQETIDSNQLYDITPSQERSYNEFLGRSQEESDASLSYYLSQLSQKSAIVDISGNSEINNRTIVKCRVVNDCLHSVSVRSHRGQNVQMIEHHEHLHLVFEKFQCVVNAYCGY